MSEIDMATIRSCHIPSPTATDWCVYCDDAHPCSTLLLCDVVERVRVALAMDERSSVRVAAALVILDGVT